MEPFACVVVGAVDYGEADRIVRLLCAEQGRTACMVHRARGGKGRHAGLDVGARVRVELRQGRGGLPSLRHVEVDAVPRQARKDIERLALLAYGCEICAGLAPEHHEATKLYRLLTTWLDLLEGEGTPGVCSRLALEAKALTFAGLAPALLACTRCGLPSEGPMTFDADAGGAQHQHCGAGTGVELRALEALEMLRRTPLADTADLPELPGVRWLLSDFVRHQMGRQLKSRALLEDLSVSG